MIPFSILDLSPIAEGSNAAESFRNTLDLAQHAERSGYKRHWLAEHHGMPGIASTATAVLMAHVAAGTSTIRIGAVPAVGATGQAVCNARFWRVRRRYG